MTNDKPKKLVSAAEEDKISRAMLVWLNTWPDKPVDLIRYEFLPADVGTNGEMALSTIQSTYIVRRYIYGGYRAEYQFKIIFRLKAGTSTDKRLKADELLNSLGDWVMEQPHPDIGEGRHIVRIEPTTRSSLFALYDNGEEDHQILMKMNYEVI